MLKNNIKKYLDKHTSSDLKDKLIIIIGATSGIGLKALEEILYLKAKVIIAARDIEKAKEIKKPLEEEYNTKIDVYDLDLSSIESIKKFVTRIKRAKLDLYGVILNAGEYGKYDSFTNEGFRLVMGVNYISNYVLMDRLVPYLETINHDVRIIITESNSYKRGKVDYNNFLFEKKKSDYKIYASSKLCLMKYSMYLANTLMDTHLRIIAIHPGVCRTKILDELYGPWYLAPFRFIKLLCKKTDKGALSIPIALANDYRSGSLIGPKFLTFGYPKTNKINKKAFSDIKMLLNYTNTILKKTDK